MAMSVRAGLLLAAAFVLTAFGISRAAQACSICQAGDPRFSSHGTTALTQGDFSVYLELKGWQKESGVLPGGHGDEEEEEHEEEEGKEHEKNDSRRLDLFLSWSPIDRLTLTLDVPFAMNKITEFEHDGRETIDLDGFGDISLSATYVLWRNREVLPSTWLEGTLFVKAPTGKSSRSTDGFTDPHLQLGTGSWDFGIGLGGVHRLDWGSVYGSIFYRENTEGSLDYEYGDIVLANAAFELPVGHALGRSSLEWLTLGMEINYRWADFDEFRGLRYRDSGGSIFYATPSLKMRLPWMIENRAPLLRTAVQIPVSDSSLYGSQDEDPIWSVGLQYSF